tara:strand:- start:324 stop:638 length:315 start_codon:yes stop_codon:yes gene_type:complete
MTQKEQLAEIRTEQLNMAQKQLKLAADFSSYMNKQDLITQRLFDILETNPLTKRKGIIEDIEELKPRVEQLESKYNITAGKVSISVIILTAVGGFIWKLISILD